MLSLSLLATETVFPLVLLGLKDLVLFFAEGHCLDAVRKQTPKTTSLPNSAVFLLCVESSFWYLQLPRIADDMQLLSVVSHSCVLAHAPPENLEGRVPCPVHHHAAWEHGSGLRVLEEGQAFWNGDSQDRVGSRECRGGKFRSSQAGS